MRKFLVALLVLAACNESPTAPVVQQIDTEPSNTTIWCPAGSIQAVCPLPAGTYDLTSPEWRIAFGHSWWSNSGSLIECHWIGSLRIQQQPGGRDFTGSVVSVGETCFDSALGFVTPPTTTKAISNGRVSTIIGGITMITFDIHIGGLPKCTVWLYPKGISVAHGQDCQTRPAVIYR